MHTSMYLGIGPNEHRLVFSTLQAIMVLDPRTQSGTFTWDR